MATERWWQSSAIGLLHLILFGFAFGIGFIVEAFVSQRYYPQSHLVAFAPCIAAIAFLTAFLVNRAQKHRLPLFFGVVAVLYLASAIRDEGRGWQYSWSHESKSQYLVHSFFGTEQQCSGSDCVAELFFTMPCVAAAAYSLGAAAGLIIPARLRAGEQARSTP